MNGPGPSISTGTGRTPPRDPSGGARRRRRRRLGAALAAGALAAAACVLAGGGVSGCGPWESDPSDPDVGDLPADVVRRGPMAVTLTESGEVVAEKQQVINNDLRWSAIIEEIAPEGQIVQKNQLLIRFRCDELADAIEEQQILARAANDNHVSALTSLELKKMKMDAQVRKAEQALADAKADLKKYQEAEWPQQRDEATAEIQLAQRDLKLAEHKLASKLKINADPELNKPYSQNEIDAERLSVERLKLSLRQAETDKKILQDYTHPRTLRDKKIAVEDTELEQLSAKAERDKELKLATSAADLAAHKSKQQKEKLDKYLEDRKLRLRVLAKEPGLVVYETRRRRWQRPITVAIGEKIDRNQQLMIIPDLTTLVMKTQVYEAIHEQVSAGLPARIRLDARRGEVLRGKISKVASLPDSQNPWLSPGVKVYPTTIAFEGTVDELGLKPGMTGDVDITVAELDNVLSVPIAAVFAGKETTYCWRVRADDRAERVVVKVGLSSSERVQILAGLAEGNRVLLVPPPGTRPERKLQAEKEAKEPAPPAPTGGAARPADAPRPAATRPARPPRRAGPDGRRSRPRPANTGRRRP